MDISQISPDKTTIETGIKISQDDAPIKVIEFINLRCPYCRRWFNDSKEAFAAYVNVGKIQRIIKLFDKEKPSLAKGNIMHKFVPKNSDILALEAIAKIYDTQDVWGEMDEYEEIADFAKNELQLSLAEDDAQSEAIINEAKQSGIQFIPTMVVGNHVFDQNISQDEFKAILDGQTLFQYIK